MEEGPLPGGECMSITVAVERDTRQNSPMSVSGMKQDMAAYRPRNIQVDLDVKGRRLI
jgi:hypothetical protein